MHLFKRFLCATNPELSDPDPTHKKVLNLVPTINTNTDKKTIDWKVVLNAK